MDVLRGAIVARYHERLLRALADADPDAVQGHSESSLREHVRVGVEKGAELAIVETADVLRYVGLLLRFGVSLDADPRRPAVGYLLRQSGKSARNKLADVEAWFLAHEGPP